MSEEYIKEINVHREFHAIDHEAEQTSTTINPSNIRLIHHFIKHPVFAILIYVVLGIFVFYSLIMIFTTHVIRLKVDTAVVGSQIETMVAPMSGYITHVYIHAGEQIKKGAPLLKIESLALEQALQLAKVQFEESQLDVQYYQSLLKNERQRLKVYEKIGHNRLASAQTFVNISKQDVVMGQRNLERFDKLYKNHYVSEALWEKNRTQYIGAQERLKHATAQKNMEHQSLSALNKGIYFTGNKAEGIERDLVAALNAAKKRAELNDKRVLIYKNLIGKLTLFAPFDAKITQILKSAGNTTDNIKPIIFIENMNNGKHIIAYLTQEEIIKIGASEQVKIYIPSIGKTYTGRILKIDRTDGFVDVIKAQYRWRDFQVDRSAMVIIEVQKKDKKSFSKSAFSGMPAIVYFSKKFHL